MAGDSHYQCGAQCTGVRKGSTKTARLEAKRYNGGN